MNRDEKDTERAIAIKAETSVPTTANVPGMTAKMTIHRKTKRKDVDQGNTRPITTAMVVARIALQKLPHL
jgi:hypothetical protein